MIGSEIGLRTRAKDFVDFLDGVGERNANNEASSWARHGAGFKFRQFDADRPALACLDREECHVDDDSELDVVGFGVKKKTDSD